MPWTELHLLYAMSRYLRDLAAINPFYDSDNLAIVPKPLKEERVDLILIAGIAFLLLAIAGQVAGRIAVAPERQRWAAIIGGGLLAIGLALHIVPQLQSEVIPPQAKRVPTSGPSTPATKEPPPQSAPSTPEPPVSASPSSGPVQSYRLRTDYLGSSYVEFSVFVNDVQVGAYSADGAIADITRFIKPGANKVRITWTADPNMSNYANIIIEVKQSERWVPLIFRQVRKATKPGETTSMIIHHGNASE